jgi:hypothetical protein
MPLDSDENGRGAADRTSEGLFHRPEQAKDSLPWKRTYCLS